MSKQRSNVVSLKTPSSSALQFEIETLFNNLLTQHILPCLPSATDALVNYISKQLESAASNKDLMYLIEVEKKLKQNRNKIIDDYTNLLFESISDWMNPDTVDQETTTDSEPESSLCLLENATLEYKLAWQAAARQIDMSEQLQSLYNCESRLDEFNTTEPERIPIGSIVICEHFATALSSLNLDLDIIQNLLLQLAKQVKPAANKMWVEADKRLATMGFELKTPKISTYTDTDSPDHSNIHPAQTSINTATSSTDTDTAFIDDIAQQVVSRVESLLNQQFSHSAEHQGTDGSASVIFAAQGLAATLTCIQNELTEQHSSIFNLSESIKAALIDKGIKQSLSPRHEDLIDMVGLLFEYIIDDHELPDEVKKLIGLLQIPVLKLALIDKEFLSKREHPGRQLLNDMTSAGMHCTNHEKEILSLIETTVKTIIHGFTDNPNIFTDCLNDFNNSLLQIENDGIAAIDIDDWITDNSEVSDEAVDSLGIEDNELENNMTESIIGQVINVYKSRYTIPDALRELVSSGWKGVLQYSLDHNEPDESWFHRVNTLDMLLWSLQDDHKESISSDDWLTIKSHVLNQLNEVGFNPFNISEWLHSLNSISNHDIELEEEIVIQKKTEEYTESNTVTDSEHGETELPALDTPEQQNAMTSDSDDTLKPEVGQWVEFIGKNEHRLRCKLATIDLHTDRYVFVNKSGMKVADWSGTELGKAIKNQSLEILDNHQFFDRALQAVMGSFLKFK